MKIIALLFLFVAFSLEKVHHAKDEKTNSKWTAIGVISIISLVMLILLS